MSRLISTARWPLALWRSRRGATTVEYAFALPVLLLLSLGAMECGLMAFEFHRLGEAMRSAARSFEIDPPVSQFGDLPVFCPEDAECNGARITAVTQQIQTLLPGFAAGNLQVVVRASGLDDPQQTPNIVTPTITVSAVNWAYRYRVLRFVVPGLAATVTLPPFTTTRVLSTRLL